MASRFAGLKDSKFYTMTAMLNVKVSQFHKNIKCSTGPKLDELKVIIFVIFKFIFLLLLRCLVSPLHSLLYSIIAIVEDFYL